jgi:predicted peptidase
MCLMDDIQQAHTFQGQVTISVSLQYLLYLPKAYDPHQRQRWPLLLYLHGSGERGTNLELVKRHGPPKLIAEGQDFPFIVVSPQCAMFEGWMTKLHVLSLLLDEIESKYAVDAERIYVTGNSMGGFGTWALAIAHPQRFAAIAPICGGGDPSAVCALQRLPVWTFHGAKDIVIPIEYTEQMVERLKGCDGNVQFTIYPEAKHDSWTRTYADPQLYTWFLEHSKAAEFREER